MNSLNPIADLPLGFGLALVQDQNAMAYFSSLSPDAQRALIDQTHSVSSRDEMQSFVHGLAGQNDF